MHSSLRAVFLCKPNAFFKNRTVSKKTERFPKKPDIDKDKEKDTDIETDKETDKERAGEKDNVSVNVSQSVNRTEVMPFK